MEWLVTSMALGLDTLPQSGRVMLQALLMSMGLCALVRWLPGEVGHGANVLYRKGALMALLCIPPLMFVMPVQLSVPVEQVPALRTSLPAMVTWGLVTIWMLGLIWRMVRLLSRVRRTFTRSAEASQGVPEKWLGRLAHWQQRLNFNRDIVLVMTGSEPAWHHGTRGLPTRIVLPQAAQHWPIGVVDVMLLLQLAQLQQSSWRWLLLGELVSALYWPMPWVGRLAGQLSQHMLTPAVQLAQAAYRDADGWRRDAKQHDQRLTTLRLDEARLGWLRLPQTVSADIAPDEQDAISRLLRREWIAKRRARQHAEQDPHEQAYWLIAIATLFAGVTTTLTLVKAPPEFEPEFLDIQWHQQMVRTIQEYHEEQTAPVGGKQAEPEPPRTQQSPST